MKDETFRPRSGIQDCSQTKMKSNKMPEANSHPDRRQRRDVYLLFWPLSVTKLENRIATVTATVTLLEVECSAKTISYAY